MTTHYKFILLRIRFIKKRQISLNHNTYCTTKNYKKIK